jgi:hypothetical protein
VETPVKFDRQSSLARLAFSFFVIAAVLVYEGWRASRAAPPVSRGLLALYAGAAALSLVLGLAGLRARHRRDR